MKKKEISTKDPQFILASSSRTRKKQIEKELRNVSIKSHKINESKVKKQNSALNVTDLGFLLAKKKAESILEKHPKGYVIGSDQLLVCDNRIVNKATSTKKAIENLSFISGKKHCLLSFTFVYRDGKFFFKEVKKANLKLKKMTKEQIKSYVLSNTETALTTVGSYKIEENYKHKLIKVIDGDEETILGFPIKNFIKKVKSS